MGKGKFLVSVSSKGGVGKSTISYQVLTALAYEMMGQQKVRLIEVDDNNKTDTFNSAIFSSQSFRVDKGIDETLKSLFDVLSDEVVVVDAGGGNDSNKVLDSLLSLQMDENIIYFIPVLKNKSGMKNLLDTYNKIREKSSSKIVIVLNQAAGKDDDALVNEFLYFYGNKELKVNGAFADAYKDENIFITYLQDTNVYDLSESFGLTAYEIAKEKIDINKFLKEEREKGYEEFMKALSFTKVYNLCLENKKQSFEKFKNDINLKW